MTLENPIEKRMRTYNRRQNALKFSWLILSMVSFAKLSFHVTQRYFEFRISRIFEFYKKNLRAF